MTPKFLTMIRLDWMAESQGRPPSRDVVYQKSINKRHNLINKTYKT